MCVTGAQGCLGSALVPVLQAAGASVRSVVRPGATAIDWSGTAPETHEADLADPASMAVALEGATITMHLAALVHADERRHDWDAFYEANVATTLRLFAAGVAAGVRRFVFVSSMSAIGAEGSSTTPLTEEDACKPVSLYGKSKLAAEAVLRDLAAGSDCELVIVRPSMLFGARDRGNFARMLLAIRRGRFVLPGSGTARKSVCYAGNAATALALAAGSRQAAGRLYLLGDDPAPTIRDLVEHIRDALWPVTSRRPWVPSVPAGVLGAVAKVNGSLTRIGCPEVVSTDQVDKLTRDAVIDASRIRRELGYTSAIPLRDGIAHTVGWFHRAGLV